MTTPTAALDVPALHHLLATGHAPRLIDVRTPAEFETAHIPGSYNVPLDLLREHRDELRNHLDEQVVLICRSGQRAAQAEQALAGAGLPNLRVLTGGITAWQAAHAPVTTGQPRWELERQVRLVAGGIVLAAVLASTVAEPAKWGGPPSFGGGPRRRGAHQHLRDGHAAGQAALQPRSAHRPGPDRHRPGHGPAVVACRVTAPTAGRAGPIMIAAIGFGALIGILLGLLGGGGSILAVPALVYGAGLTLAAAVPTSLLVVGVSSAAALLPRLRAGLVRWRIAAIVGGTGALAAFAGAAVNRLLDPRLVLAGFAALMVVAGLRMLSGADDCGGDCALPGGRVNWRGCLPKSVAAGLAVGFLTGLFGVGGGFLIIPALVLLLGLSMPAAVATSLVVIVVNSAAGFAAHAGDAAIDYGVAAAFTVAAVTGSLAAGRIAARLPTQRLQRAFAWFVLAVAGFVGVQAAVALATA